MTSKSSKLITTVCRQQTKLPANTRRTSNSLHRGPVILTIALFAFAVNGAAQSAPPAAAPIPPATPQATTASPIPLRVPHRFWDRENDLLFTGVAVSRSLDFASTIHNRNRGLNEGLLTNQIVDNHPLFFGIEAGTTAASIALSYLFHRTNHHRLERWVSIVHIGVATGGAIRNYALKSPPSQNAPTLQ